LAGKLPSGKKRQLAASRSLFIFIRAAASLFKIFIPVNIQIYTHNQ
jgi:hypothetical protein